MLARLCIAATPSLYTAAPWLMQQTESMMPVNVTETRADQFGGAFSAAGSPPLVHLPPGLAAKPCYLVL